LIEIHEKIAEIERWTRDERPVGRARRNAAQGGGLRRARNPRRPCSRLRVTRAARVTTNGELPLEARDLRRPGQDDGQPAVVLGPGIVGRAYALDDRLRLFPGATRDEQGAGGCDQVVELLEGQAEDVAQSRNNRFRPSTSSLSLWRWRPFAPSTPPGSRPISS